MSDLKDQESRDAAITKHGKSIFIDAGAGTGKTETIVRRIVDRIMTDPTIEMKNVSAITFTDKAGAELRNRFRSVLTKTLGSAKETDKPSLENALAQLDSAAIGTIHSFCKRVLSDHSLAAKLPVGFQVASETSGPSLKVNRARRVADVALANLTENERALLKHIRIDPNQFQVLVEKLDSKFATLSNLGSLSSSVDKANDFEVAIYAFINYAIDELRNEQESRRASGDIEFDDLLLLTRDLLDGNQELQKLVSDTYKILLVDEFQDTDPVQWRIIQLVTSTSSNQQHRAGSLVLVGDPKQSIYRFRNADLNTFLEVKKDFGDTGDLGAIHTLSSNFRTVKPIIEFVNTIFRDEIGTSPNPLHMGVPYQELDIVNDPSHPKPGPAVVALVNPTDGNKKLVDYEFAQVSRQIQRAVAEKWAITVKGNDGRVYGEKPADYGDVCILLPARTRIDDLLRSLAEHKIPFMSADPGIVLDRPLVLGIVNALKVIAQTDNELALFASLKSPLFGLNDIQLYNYKQTQDAYWNTEGGAVGANEVSDALTVLYEIRNRYGKVKPAAIIQGLLDELQIFEKLNGDENGDFEAKSIRILLSHASQWENDGKFGLLAYLESLEILMSENNRSPMPTPDEINSNSVQIMTIHAAKGLEFPITILAGMASTIGYRTEPILISKSGQVEFNLGSGRDKMKIESSGYDELKNGEMAVESAAESNRLIYVAMTRARDHLVVSAIGAAEGGKIPRSRPIIEALASFKKSGVETKYEEAEPITQQLEVPPRNDNINLDFIDTYNPDFESVRAKSNIQHLVSPSSDLGADMKVLAKAKTKPLATRKNSNLDNDAADSSDTSSASRFTLAKGDGRPFGRALHGTMDLIMRMNRVPTDSEVVALVTAKTLQENAVEFEADILNRVRLLLGSNIVQEALSSAHRWPELHLAIADSSDDIRVAEGFADLVYKSDSGYVLVDYKTDKTIDADTYLHYQQQLSAYSIILQNLLGEAPAKIVVLHVTPDTVKEIKIPIPKL